MLISMSWGFVTGEQGSSARNGQGCGGHGRVSDGEMGIWYNSVCRS